MLIRQMAMREIISVECELTAYRKGVLSVRIQFGPGVLIWKESRQWCNNFVRTLNDEQAGELRRLVEACLIQAEDPDGKFFCEPAEEILLILSLPDSKQILDRKSVV